MWGPFVEFDLEKIFQFIDNLLKLILKWKSNLSTEIKICLSIKEAIFVFSDWNYGQSSGLDVYKLSSTFQKETIGHSSSTRERI